jgi:3',5'-cyclic AMP phosphodiesterase CpdA
VSGPAGVISLGVPHAFAAKAPAAAAPAEKDDGSFFFCHMADPQLFWNIKDKPGSAVANWNNAIAAANRLKPKFVIVGGDLLNRNGVPRAAHAKQDEERAKAYLDAVAKLDKGIPLYNVAGNHDVGNTPTPETLAWYEERFGKYWYTFRHGTMRGFVLESNMLKNPQNCAKAVEAQKAWFTKALAAADAEEGVTCRLVFLHHPVCLTAIDEKNGYFNLSTELRTWLVELCKAHKVQAVFSGHNHRNRYVKVDDLELITTSGITISNGVEPGFRIVRVTPTGIEHKHYAHEDVPEAIDATQPLP